MSDYDQLNDSPVLSELRDSMACVTLPARPRLEAITARSRAHRRRRRSAIASLSVAGAAALVLGLTGVLGSTPARNTGTIRTAAFTIVGHANGTATLTITPEVLFEPSTLQSDLAQYSIPATVTTGSFCSSDPAPDGFSQVVSFPPIASYPGPQQPPDTTITINPGAMPAGTELSFGIFQLSTGVRSAIALIDTNSNSCASTVPATLPPGGALLNWGGPAVS